MTSLSRDCVCGVSKSEEAGLKSFGPRRPERCWFPQLVIEEFGNAEFENPFGNSDSASCLTSSHYSGLILFSHYLSTFLTTFVAYSYCSGMQPFSLFRLI